MIRRGIPCLPRSTTVASGCACVTASRVPLSGGGVGGASSDMTRTVCRCQRVDERRRQRREGQSLTRLFSVVNNDARENARPSVFRGRDGPRERGKTGDAIIAVGKNDVYPANTTAAMTITTTLYDVAILLLLLILLMTIIIMYTTHTYTARAYECTTRVWERAPRKRRASVRAFRRVCRGRWTTHAESRDGLCERGGGGDTSCFGPCDIIILSVGGERAMRANSPPPHRP